MKYLSLLHPFGRIQRLMYLVAVLCCLAAGWAGLNVIRFGGEDWKLGLILFWGALYILFNSMVNRIRDADASAGWFLFPIFVMVVAFTIAIYSGPLDLAGQLPNRTALDQVATWPVRVMMILPSVLLPLMIAMATSLFFWAFSLFMLAILPSRPRRG